MFLSRVNLAAILGCVADKLTPERRRELTRDALLDAAEDVFVKKGVGAASMEEIASEAGFSRGAIYFNFGNKDELLLAVCDRFLTRQVQRYTALGAHDDPLAGALDAAELYRHTETLELVPLELELRLNALRNPVLRQRVVEADRRLSNQTARLVEVMIADGATLNIPPRDLADIGRAAVVGLLHYAAIDRENEPRYQQLVETLFLLLTQAVTNAPTASRAKAPRRKRSQATRPSTDNTAPRRPAS